MSVKISGAVWELDIDPTGKLILLALADHADHEGNNVRPGNDLLCAKTGLTQPTITARLKKFVDDGILEPQTKSTPGRGNCREFSMDISGLNRRDYFIKKDEKKKVKARHTFDSEASVRKQPALASQKVKTDTTEKVKTDEEKVKADTEKVKTDEIAYKEVSRHEPSIEPSKGEPESTPFDSFSFDFSTYEESSEKIQDALRKIFPAMPRTSGRISELTLFVLGLKAPAAYVLAWPKWFRGRYPGKPADHFKFGDTFEELADEGMEPNAWLNGSVGSRLVAACSGHLAKKGEKEKPVPAIAAHRITAIGHWLDDQVCLPDGDIVAWKARHLTPTKFADFWVSRFENSGRPTPESVMKYWPDFLEWLKKEGAE